MQKLTGMDAVKKAMPLARLARELGITRGAVAQWDRVPAERLREVAIATGISIEVLRPDLFQEAGPVSSRRAGPRASLRVPAKAGTM